MRFPIFRDGIARDHWSCLIAWTEQARYCAAWRTSKRRGSTVGSTTFSLFICFPAFICRFYRTAASGSHRRPFFVDARVLSNHAKISERLKRRYFPIRCAGRGLRERERHFACTQPRFTRSSFAHSSAVRISDEDISTVLFLMLTCEVSILTGEVSD